MVRTPPRRTPDPSRNTSDDAELRVTAGFDPVRTILEDFDDVAGQVLIPRADSEALGRPLMAVLIARMLRRKSIDEVRRTYVDGIPAERPTRPHDPAAVAYIAAYRAAKHHVFAVLTKLDTVGKRLPTMGEFAASVALERLPHSFFSAHLLYRLGHRYEGHAVSRHILEQIAWASAAAPLNDVAAIKALQTTRTVSTLTKFYAAAGRLYGFLSDKTHVDYMNHFEFIRVEGGRNAFLATQARFLEYAEVILTLADAFSAVWEASQMHYIRTPDATVVRAGLPVLRDDRPFATVLREHLIAVERATSADTPSGPGANKRAPGRRRKART